VSLLQQDKTLYGELCPHVKLKLDLYSALLAWGLNCGRMEAFSSPLRWRCFHGYPTA
jgi:hypothetical protein